MNLAHFLVRNAERAADRPAVGLGPDPVFTHRQLRDRVARLAGAMRMLLEPGDRVAIVSANRPEYVELLAATWWAGLAAVPVNVKLHPKELAFILDNAEAGLVLVDETTAAKLQTDKPVTIIGSTDYRRMLEAEPMPVFEVASDAMAWLFYTSGTTGRPKGAIITHRNIRAMTYAYFIDIDRIDAHDCILHAAPMSHGSGLYLIPHLAKGACQVIPESGGYDPAEITEIWQHRQGCTMFAAPTMVKRLTRHAQSRSDADFPGLKTIVYGGAPMYLDDLDQAHRTFGFKFAQLYGQGEAPMTITALDKAAHSDTTQPRYRQRLASAGTAQSVVEVKILGPDGHEMPRGEPGEIVAKGDVVVPGYWRDPEATAKTMGDGWLKTGDLGSMDEDGFVTLKDRSKDLIISGGSNIYPREIEEILLTHPDVREAAVIGIPDPEWGEIAIACIAADRPDLEAELDRLCLDQIARFKRPKAYRFLENLPKNHYGKILKTELRKLFS